MAEGAIWGDFSSALHSDEGRKKKVSYRFRPTLSTQTTPICPKTPDLVSKVSKVSLQTDGKTFSPSQAKAVKMRTGHKKSNQTKL